MSQWFAWTLHGTAPDARYLYMQYAAALPEQQVPHSVSSAEMLKASLEKGCSGALG